jgi:uncharacterized protein (TIGR03435 family)
MRTLTGVLLAITSFAQTRQFEVASVKLHAPDQLSLSEITTDSGRFRAGNVDIKQLIGYAYDISPLLIAGDLPATRFDVEGKAEGPNTRAGLRVMLKALLADRFAVRLHREIRERSVDALVVSKSPKLQISESTDPDPRGFVLHSGKRPGHVAVEGHSISMPGLVNYLSNHHRDRLIVDATGLKGVYDFSVEYEIDTEKVTDRNVPVSDAAASLMDDLVQALGFKIESGRRLPVEMLVIDRISSPEPN